MTRLNNLIFQKQIQSTTKLTEATHSLNVNDRDTKNQYGGHDIKHDTII